MISPIDLSLSQDELLALRLNLRKRQREIEQQIRKINTVLPNLLNGLPEVLTGLIYSYLDAAFVERVVKLVDKSCCRLVDNKTVCSLRSRLGEITHNCGVHQGTRIINYCKKYPMLRELRVESFYCTYQRKIMPHIAKLKMLHTLKLEGAVDEDILHLLDLPLKKLDLSDSMNLSDTGLYLLHKLQLDTVDISKCKYVTSKGIDYLTKIGIKNIHYGYLLHYLSQWSIIHF